MTKDVSRLRHGDAEEPVDGPQVGERVMLIELLLVLVNEFA
jgi:hypothetical protein